MGGGASTSTDGELDDIIACTFLIGRAIASVQYPDMYRVMDFHSKRARPLAGERLSYETVEEGGVRVYRLKKAESQAADTEPHDDGLPPDTLRVTVAEDTVVLETPNTPNEDGWSPLHACCHSITTVPAGLAIIDWILEHGGGAKTLNMETKRGPGAFNAQWTPIHIASAYGVEALVEKLAQAGADVNTKNSLGWTPLQEACHRGFVSIIKTLVMAGADINYIPEEAVARNTPFLRAPAQSPLGEVCRCGFKEAVRFLLDNGADKDQQNALGSTPMHEAAFFNQSEVVQMLLVYGASATIRNNQGALPHHLASMPDLKALIKELGGDEAAAEQIKPACPTASTTPSPPRPVGIESATRTPEVPSMAPPGKSATAAQTNFVRKASSKIVDSEDESHETKSSEFLHRGGLLGDLPTLEKKDTGLTNAPRGKAFAVSEEMRKDRRKMSVEGERQKLRTNAGPAEDADDEVPSDLQCELCHRLLRHPMRTPYGHVYERDVIKKWFRKHGSIDPLTGQPLAPSELQEDKELATRIKAWRRSRQSQDEQSTEVHQQAAAKLSGFVREDAEASSNVHAAASAKAVTDQPAFQSEEELYDF